MGGKDGNKEGGKEEALVEGGWWGDEIGVGEALDKKRIN